jgi:hypothetical protein
MPIPMKPPLCSEMITPPVSGMISPPFRWGLQAMIVVSSLVQGVKLFGIDFAASFRR